MSTLEKTVQTYTTATTELIKAVIDVFNAENEVGLTADTLEVVTTYSDGGSYIMVTARHLDSTVPLARIELERAEEVIQ